MASSTIFFDGFGPWGGGHTGEIDPQFWSTTGTVSLSDYRLDRSYGTVNGTTNGKDFMGYTFGALAKLNSHNSNGDRATLKINNFATPSTNFTSPSKAFGIGYYVNKIATDSIMNGSAPSDYAAKVISLHNKLSADSSVVDVLTIEAVHLSTLGYSGVSSPKVGLKVTQTISGTPEVLGTFTFDVFGAPWYVDNSNSISSTKQRTIDAYDYKYGGLYVEICVSPEFNPVPDITIVTTRSTPSGSSVIPLDSLSGLSVGMGVASTSVISANTKIVSIDTTTSEIVTTRSTPSGSSVIPLDSVSGLSVGMVVTSTSGISANTKIVSIDAIASEITISNNTTEVIDSGVSLSFTDKTITISNNTTGAINSGVSLDFTNKIYALQIKVNGMNLTVDGTVDAKKLYIKDNFNTSINTKQYFDSATFYGARIPNNTDPWTGLSNSYSYLYHTYIDNVYLIEGLTEQECLLGPTTKIFNIVPQVAGADQTRVNTSWQAFNLNWSTNTTIEENLKDSNGDTSYVFTETSGAVLSMKMAPGVGDSVTSIPNDANYAIGGIKITNSVRKSNKDTSFVNVWGTGLDAVNMNPIGADFPITNNHYEYKNQYILTNPVSATGWTFSDINDGKFGIKKTS
jgi:hypothetical protein